MGQLGIYAQLLILFTLHVHVGVPSVANCHITHRPFQSFYFVVDYFIFVFLYFLILNIFFKVIFLTLYMICNHIN